MKNNPFSAIFFFVAFIALMNGGLPAVFPLVIIYFIVKSFIGGNGRNRGGRNDDRRSRDYERNRRREDRRYEQRDRPEDRRSREREEMQRDYDRKRRDQEKRRQRAQAPKPRPRNNPYKQSGVKKFQEYDYDGAIEDFTKALELDSSDVAVHFNLACCYSLNENKDNAFYHLSKAVALGFKDFNKIQDHDALAYLRIQDEFDQFKENGYRIVDTKMKVDSAPNQNGDLLEQLKKLQELRERGVLTEEEFVLQKEKLLG